MFSTLLLATVLTLTTSGKPAVVSTPHSIIHQSIVVDDKRTVYLEGPITDELADRFITDIQALPGDKPIFIIFNSNGGSIESMFRMDNVLDGRKNTVGIVERGCYSACGNVLLHTKTRYVEAHADVMYHEGSMSIQADRPNFMSRAKHSEEQFHQMNVDNAARIGIPLEEYTKRVAGEWWLTDSQLCEQGITHAIVDGFESKHKVVAPPPDEDPDWLKRLFQ